MANHTNQQFALVASIKPLIDAFVKAFFSGHFDKMIFLGCLNK
jgi:hypothetical protein